MAATHEPKDASSSSEEVSDRIFTLANVITFIRFCATFVALAILLQGHDIIASIVFALTALTDFVDGQVARRTHTVTRLGQLFDPVVDRVLMICAVLGLLLVGRLPLWVVIFVLARDLIMLIGGGILLRKYSIRIPVIYPGKVATTLLFIGLAGLMLNWPRVPGLGLVDAPWLPGFDSVYCSWGIWAVYLGLLLAIFTTGYYILAAIRELRKVRASRFHGTE